MVAISDTSIYASSHDHDAYFDQVTLVATDMDLDNVRILTDITADECLVYMASSKIFYIRTHGAPDCIALADRPLTITELNGFSSTAFSYCQLILYGACLTGQGNNRVSNFVNCTHSHGATTVVGFENSVACSQMSLWGYSFFAALADGEDVGTACNSAHLAVDAAFTEPVSTIPHYISGSATQSFVY